MSMGSCRKKVLSDVLRLDLGEGQKRKGIFLNQKSV